MRQMMHSFRGEVAPPELLQAIAEGQITSIGLFSFNVESLAQVRQLTTSLTRAATDNGHLPPMIAIDQEGGQLIAITAGATELPGNMALGATRDPELARLAGYVLGRELLAMGINMNFAPSIDVNVNPFNPVIGIRAFGQDPQLVGELGVALVKGMQEQGVMAVAKHFPGHGDIAVDTHYSAPIIKHDMKRITEVELRPFEMVIAENVDSIMTAHILFEVLDAENPATVSSKILTELLRNEMGYDGLIMTDAMDMHAVSHLGTEASLRGALSAGADILLLAHVPDQLHWNQQLRHLENPESVARIQQAQRRIPTQLPDLSVVGCAEHQAIAQKIADHSITVVRDHDQIIPLQPTADSKIAVITPIPQDLTPADTSSRVKIRLGEAIRKRHAHTIDLSVPMFASEDVIAEMCQQVADMDLVIIGTIGAEKDTGQAQLVKQLIATGKQVIVVSLRTPYDLMAFPQTATYLCSYGIRDVSTEAVARVLFGEIIAQGVLPCDIPGIEQGVS